MTTLAALVAPLVTHRRRLVPLATALLLTYGYFIGAASWNQNSRLALTRALVETHSPIIDASHVTTGDKSYRDGHFYSDKAPGASWVATVPYALFYGLRRLTGGELPSVRVRPLDPRQDVPGHRPDPLDRQPGDVLVYNLAHRIALYLCSLVVSALPTLVAAAAVLLFALRQSENQLRTAMVVALSYALGTPAFPYSTALYGHMLCSAALLVAFAVVVLLPASGSSASPSIPGWRPAMLTGSLLGLAVATEYPAALPTLAIVGLAWARHGLRFMAWTVVGGLPWAGALAIYHTVAFGHPLSLGYDHVYRPEFAAGMAVRYGIHPPDPVVAHALLFGSYRGFLYLSPVLLLVFWGLGRGLSRRPSGTTALGRAPVAVAVGIALYYLLLNAGYYMWDGGAAFGPRHMLPALGPLMLGAIFAYQAAPRAFITLAVVSAIHMLLGCVATPEAPQHGNPLWEYAWGRLHNAELADPGRGTNLGHLLGLPGLWSLLPLGGLWLWAGPAAFSKNDPEP